MKQVFKIDSDGFFLEPVLLKPIETIPSDCVEEFPTEGLYKHKWNGESWEEGLTQAEIDAIKNIPIPKSETELLKEENIMIMEATALVYEENLQLKEENLTTMEALADVYELMLSMQGGTV